ncbi:MAG: polysaccharide deacetylase family protein [Opitutaceae bacterium]
MDNRNEAHPPWAALRRYRWITVLSKLPLVWLWPRFPGLALAVFVAPEVWLVVQTLVPNASGLGPIITRFATQAREIRLTIDDGPDPLTTPELLDRLDSHGARAVFFLIGRKARSHPDLVRAIAARGHEIGNHTDSHPLCFFWSAGPRRTAAEIDACSSAIGGATGKIPRYFRPPAGIKNLFLFGALARRRMSLLGWSGRARELGCASPERPLRRLARAVRPGAILLVHESGRNPRVRLAIIGGLLEHLDREGFRCVLPDPPDCP